MNPIKDLINKNVKWWVSQIQPFEANFNSGNTDASVDIQSNLLQHKNRKKITENQINSFKDNLFKLLMNEFLKSENIRLSVDYEPQGLLLKAVEYSGISPYVFPCKTATYIDFPKLEIKTKLGYNSPLIVLS
jgi:hypothetical protein